QMGAAGLAWIKPTSEGLSSAPVVKNAGAAAIDAPPTQAGAKKGDMVFLMAGEKESVLNLMGALRLELARRENWIPAGKWNMLWVVNFPLLEFSPEENRWVSGHHPVTAPVAEDMGILESNPGAIRA